MKPVTKNLILGALVIGLAFGPLVFKHNAQFSGADDQAKNTISSINSNYHPWFKPLWTPPSSEIESFLFALQAALGSGIVFYYLGYSKGKQKALKSVKDREDHHV